MSKSMLKENLDMSLIREDYKTEQRQNNNAVDMMRIKNA